MTSLSCGMATMSEMLQRVEDNCISAEGEMVCMLTPSPNNPPSMPTIQEVGATYEHNLSSEPEHRGHYSNAHCTSIRVNSWQDLKQALDGMQMSHMYLMVILNRCLDYHKLVNNLPLVPRYA
ncbi:hypothetical protein EON65_51495, partial [archaeon]